jgi:uncharacterized Zn-finger protein
MKAFSAIIYILATQNIWKQRNLPPKVLNFFKAPIYNNLKVQSKLTFPFSFSLFLYQNQKTIIITNEATRECLASECELIFFLGSSKN